MHHLSAWFTRNPVAANLVMGLVIIAGIFTLQSIRIEGFPTIPPSSVSITTLCPGASAEQIDRNVTRKIEKVMEGMPGVKKLSSISEEGASTIVVQKVSDFDLDRFQNEIKSRVDSIPNMPQMAERPIITRDEFNVEALIVQVYGDTDIHSLQKVAREVREDLLSDPHITRIVAFGLLPYEIRIEVDEEQMRAFNITISDLSDAINQASLDYKTGSIKSEAGTVIVRADKRALYYEEFADIPIRTMGNGTRILLKDVAHIVDGFEDVDVFARFQGQPSVGMLVYTSKKGHLLQVSAAAHKIINALRPNLPAGIHADIWGEYSVYMKTRLQLLAKNAWQGLLIVFTLLALFLSFKLVVRFINMFTNNTLSAIIASNLIRRRSWHEKHKGHHWSSPMKAGKYLQRFLVQ